MRIANNIMALNAHRQLTINQGGIAKSIEKLSSGLRINRAGDDAAGLAISEKMRGQIRGLKMAQKNAQDAISLIQTAEGALTESHAILQRMRELAVQSASDTNTDVDRLEIQKEIDQLAQELTRIAETTEFNTKKLLDGSFRGTFHIGANEQQNMSVQIAAMDAEALQVQGTAYSGEVVTGLFVVSRDGTQTLTIDLQDPGAATNETTASFDATSNTITVTLASDGTNVTATHADVLAALESVAAEAGVLFVTDDTFDGTATSTTGSNSIAWTADADQSKLFGIDVSTQTLADAAITTINNAIEKVSAERSKLGSYQNRLEHTIANLGVSAENLQAAESRIRDVDMAAEMMTFTKYQILQQASTAMLAQANLAPQSVLQLLG